MAKWGEGNPRWIVENRDDGKNVNGWHWSEVNRMEWSKQRLAELLPGVEATDTAAQTTLRVTAVKSVTGEAMLTTRKGNRRFPFFDLSIQLDWEATHSAAAGDAQAAGGVGEEAAQGEQAAGGSHEAATQVKGTMNVAEFASGSDPEDVEVTVTVAGGDSEAERQQLKRRAESALWPKVLQQLDQFVTELSQP